MKKILFSILIASIFMTPLYAASSQGTIDDDNFLELEFTNGIDANIGFTREPISGSIKPTVDGFDNHTEAGEPLIVFKPSADDGTYTTGTFNIYAQVFVPYNVKLMISGAPLSNGSTEVNYMNTATDTSAAFPGSASGSYVIVSEDLSEEKRGKPRLYNRAICLVVDDINTVMSSTDEFQGTLTIKLESN